MYRINDPAGRRPLLESLLAAPHHGAPCPLSSTQREVQSALRVWPTEPGEFTWYAGSPVINNWILGHETQGKHLLEVYEWDPRTRAILGEVLAQPGMRFESVEVRLLQNETNDYFDGEEYIATHISQWGTSDVILLDPFAIWCSADHQQKRDRYRSIFDATLTKEEKSPSLALFFVWTRADSADIAETVGPVRNGYHELGELIHKYHRRIIQIEWDWGLQFAMWLLAPTFVLDDLARNIETTCDNLRDHLLQNGFPGSIGQVWVTID